MLSAWMSQMAVILASERVLRVWTWAWLPRVPKPMTPIFTGCASASRAAAPRPAIPAVMACLREKFICNRLPHGTGLNDAEQQTKLHRRTRGGGGGCHHLRADPPARYRRP